MQGSREPNGKITTTEVSTRTGRPETVPGAPKEEVGAVEEDKNTVLMMIWDVVEKGLEVAIYLIVMQAYARSVLRLMG